MSARLRATAANLWVDPATVTSATFTVTGPSGPVTGTVSMSGNTATFTPAASLTEFATQYTAAITAGVRDRAGNTLTPRTWPFTTVIVDPGYWYRLSISFSPKRKLHQRPRPASGGRSQSKRVFTG